MQWKDIQIGHTFFDGSCVTQKRIPENYFCYEFGIKHRPFVVSEEHYILCKLRGIKKEDIDFCAHKQNTIIPVIEDIHVMPDKTVKSTIVKAKTWHTDKNLYWLAARNIYALLYQYGNHKVVPVGSKFTHWKPVGEKPCFCVSTTTGEYKCCGVINSNSVALRDIIFHSLTHSDELKLCMVDLKLSEFTRYKGMNNVVGVANSVREAAELLRLCREVMQKRNKLNADRGLTDFADYKPKDPTNKISIFGRQFDEDTIFPVEIGGEKKEMTAKEILEWTEKNYKQE